MLCTNIVQIQALCFNFCSNWTAPKRVFAYLDTIRLLRSLRICTRVLYWRTFRPVGLHTWGMRWKVGKILAQKMGSCWAFIILKCSKKSIKKACKRISLTRFLVLGDHKGAPIHYASVFSDASGAGFAAGFAGASPKIRRRRSSKEAFTSCFLTSIVFSFLARKAANISVAFS